MPYALRSRVTSDDLEVAEILTGLHTARFSESQVSCEDDANDEEYIPEEDEMAEDDTDDDEYEPVDDEGDEDADDDEYEPADDEDADDDEYEPEDSEDEYRSVVRSACSSLARGTKITRDFWIILARVRKGSTSAHFKRWMLSIPPMKALYDSRS